MALLPVRKEKIYADRRDEHVHDYKHLFRFSRENVQWLAGHFLGPDEETRGGALSPVKKYGNLASVS